MGVFGETIDLATMLLWRFGRRRIQLAVDRLRRSSGSITAPVRQKRGHVCLGGGITQFRVTVRVNSKKRRTGAFVFVQFSRLILGLSTLPSPCRELLTRGPNDASAFAEIDLLDRGCCGKRHGCYGCRRHQMTTTLQMVIPALAISAQ